MCSRQNWRWLPYRKICITPGTIPVKEVHVHDNTTPGAKVMQENVGGGNSKPHMREN